MCLPVRFLARPGKLELIAAGGEKPRQRNIPVIRPSRETLNHAAVLVLEYAAEVLAAVARQADDAVGCDRERQRCGKPDEAPTARLDLGRSQAQLVIDAIVA